MFQPAPHMVKRLRRRILDVSGIRDLVDAHWDHEHGTVCIYVRSLLGGGWRVHDALYDSVGNPRQMVEHDIDRLAWRYNSANTVEQDDPFVAADKATERRLYQHERDKNNLALGLMRGNL